MRLGEFPTVAVVGFIQLLLIFVEQSVHLVQVDFVKQLAIIYRAYKPNKFLVG